MPEMVGPIVIGTGVALAAFLVRSEDHVLTLSRKS